LIPSLIVWAESQPAGNVATVSRILVNSLRLSAEPCIRKAVSERGFSSNPVGLADAKAEDEAASRWADCAFAYGD